MSRRVATVFPIFMESRESCLAADGRAWKVNGRAQALVGPGPATPLLMGSIVTRPLLMGSIVTRNEPSTSQNNRTYHSSVAFYKRYCISYPSICNAIDRSACGVHYYCNKIFFVK